MKAVMILASLLITFIVSLASLPLRAETTAEKTLMQDFVKTKMDFMFEVKTNKYEKVILDCQSFIQGLSFYQQNKVIHNFYMESDECQSFHDYLQESKASNVPVCFEIADAGKTLNVINEKESCL